MARCEPAPPDDPADQADADGLQRQQVERRAVRATDELQRRLVAGVMGVGHRVDGAVQGADPAEPPEHVHAAIAARHPAVAADGERDVTPGEAQLVGELDTGRRRPDDEDAARRDVPGTAIGARREVGGGEVVGERRDHRLVAPAGGHDDVAGPPRAGSGGDLEARAPPAQDLDGGTGRDRGAERGGVPVEVVGERGGGDEAVRVVAGGAGAREDVHPVRGQQAQGVPGLATPAGARLVALEHDVLDATGGELMAHGEACLAGADDDGVDVSRASLRASERRSDVLVHGDPRSG